MASPRIRPIGPADEADFLEAIAESRTELGRFLQTLSRTTPAEAASWLAGRAAARSADRAFDFAIVDDATGAFCGACGINEINRHHRFANVYYWVRTARSGLGVCGDAVRQLAGFGFGELGLWRLELVIDEANAASVRVAQKLGARHEGTLRNRLSADGTPRMAEMYSLVPADVQDP